MRLFLFAATFWGLCLAPGLALQIQCYQCEEFQLNNDCSSPEFIVNCTVNVQDMCQKEVMEKSFGLYERYTNEFCDDTVPTAWCLKPPLGVSCWFSHTVCFSKPSCGLTPSPTLAPSDLIKTLARIMYRKSCASSAACLIASAGYQSFCSPGKVNSVCISCCNTPLCNGPRPKRRGNSGVVPRARVIPTILLLKFALLFLYC